MASAYTLLDFGNGERFEEWGPYRLIRPDPVAIGSPKDPASWDSAAARYEGEKGKGSWQTYEELPAEWPVAFGDVRLNIRLAPYKHTGAFPEQLKNWEWARGCAKGRSITVLNLFAYTGGATMALGKDGHFVTHVDASKPAIEWAKENATLNALPADRVRWMLEDALLFAARELKRGKKYDAIIVDAPAFGHSPSGKTWRAQRDLAPLLEICAQLLSDEPSFLLLNGYAQNDTPESFHRLLSGILHSKMPGANFAIKADDLTLRSKDGRPLSTGSVARCTFRK